MFALLKFGKKPFVYTKVGVSSRTSTETPSQDEKSSTTSDEDTEAGLDYSYGYLRRTSGHIWALPWIASTALLSVVCVGLAVCVYRDHHGTYETGFHTDFQHAINLIEIEERRFTTPPHDVMRSDVLVAWDPEVPRYVGIPSPEVDLAWNKLTGPFMQATAEEALDLPGAALQNGHYWTTTTVQHTLHCLNHIRKALYGHDYYPQINPNASDHWPHGGFLSQKRVLSTSLITFSKPLHRHHPPIARMCG